MKKLKKNIKWGILAFLTGEFLALWHSDRSFRKKVSKEQNWGKKISIIAHELFGFNKQLVSEAKEIDYHKKGKQAVAYVEEEVAYFKDQLQELEDKWKDLSKDKIKPTLKELETKFKTFSQKAKTKYKDLDETYDLEAKVKEIKAQLTKLKKRKLS